MKLSINISFKKSTVTALSLFLFASFSATAAECPHGALSKQFCDRDNDMMADSPKTPTGWLDPYTLVFGNVPSQSFIFDKGAKRALMKHIEKVTGKQVEFFPYQTNSAELEAMRSGLLHIAGMNTGSVPTAVNCAGFHLFAMTAKADGDYGYTMQLITYPESGFHSIYDIKDETILFTSSSSNSGHKAPVAILQERFSMREGIDYKSRFSGSHIKSVIKVAHKEYKVAAIASGFTTALMLHDKIPQDSVKIIYESDSFPSTGYGYNHRLKPELAQKIEEAFKTFRWREDNRTEAKAFNKFGDNHFIPANYKKNWKIIRDIDKANDITYDCR
jgi:phosphonate transport system substrate-binding protein